MNFLEQLPFILVVSIVAGIVYPWITFAFQLTFIIGRILFSIGYTKCGPGARVPGALIMDVVILGVFGLSIASLVKIW